MSAPSAEPASAGAVLVHRVLQLQGGLLLVVVALAVVPPRAAGIATMLLVVGLRFGRTWFAGLRRDVPVGP